ncbi:hypothetical protein GALL_363320 [mine drainage metagenome]|uniref:Uncharacterized protein n=1 Tax=mine drainage metagenome TaxID=410659 RepID=A0A1J5R147_9ZZZZ
MPTTDSATSTGYSKRSMSRLTIYSCPTSSTAAPDSSTVTLAKRAKASLMNSPPNAVCAPPGPNPIHTATATNTSAVAVLIFAATRSLPV